MADSATIASRATARRHARARDGTLSSGQGLPA